MVRAKDLFVRYKFMGLAIVLLWLKTYVLYKVGFDIKSESVLQEFLLFINPISSAVLIIGLSIFFKDKLKHRMVIILSIIGTCILYGNLIFFRSFTDFLTLPVLFQTSNAGDLSSSLFELIVLADILLFLDIIILAYIIKKKNIVISSMKYDRPLILAVSAAIFLINLTIAQAERPQLLTRAFDREMLVKNIGMFNYHIYDVILQSKSKTQRVLADSSDIVEVKNYTKTKYQEPNEELFGIAKDKNIVVLSLESLQSFVINETVDGEEITPFLNDLIADSYYFDNFYHQTAQGKTSDSEFLLDNSLFGKASGAVFFTSAGNEYNALPEILNGEGYFTSVMHANNKSFWNRDMMYPALGYEKFFDIDYYQVDETNSVGWGLKDEHFFEQSINLLKSQKEPYYTKFITLTNHFPFELDEEDKFINEFQSNSRTLNRYVTTVRYMDEAVKGFFERLKQEGMYEDTIFIIYGDHNGISDKHNKAMSMFLEKEEITPFDSVQLQRVPLYVHIPGHTDNKTISTVSGQIDLKPTILHLLGIALRDDIQFGTDLFAPGHKPFVVLRDGSFITDEYVFTNGSCYEKQLGQEIDAAVCEPYKQKAELDLQYSDKVINGDLLRFSHGEEKE